MNGLPVVLCRANERHRPGAQPRETNVFGAFLPLGVAQLAACVRESGREVRAIDGTVENHNPDSHARAVGSGFRGVVAFSSTTLNWPSTLAAIRAVKRVSPEAVVVVGGPQMDVYPEEVLGFSEVDFGIVGEGERALVELVAAIEDGRDATAVPGVLALRDGRVTATPPAAPIEDLGDLPFPALDLFPVGRYRAVTVPAPFTTMITSRGCPYRCRFCSQRYAGGVFRRRPTRHVIGEMEEHVRRYRSREIVFFDETFTIGERRVIELCEGLIDMGAPVGFNIRARADGITSDVARALFAAGCTGVSLGIESGSDRILKKMNKGETTGQIREAVRICREARLVTRGYFMLGYVGETAGEMEETIRFACELPLDYASFTITQLNPGTPDYEQAMEDGEVGDYWRDFTLGKKVPARPPRPKNSDFSEEGLQKELKRAYRRFFLRPRIIGRRLLDRRVWRWALEALLSPRTARNVLAELGRSNSAGGG